MRTGLANGCFDGAGGGLHEGHRHLIGEAQKQCDRLIVALNSDDSIRALKGPERPIDPLNLRANNVLSCLRPDDLAMAFESEEDLLSLIALNKPDVIFKGAEYEGKPVTGSDLAEVVFIPMKLGYSTTAIIEERKLREAGD